MESVKPDKEDDEVKELDAATRSQRDVCACSCNKY